VVVRSLELHKKGSETELSDAQWKKISELISSRCEAIWDEDMRRCAMDAGDSAAIGACAQDLGTRVCTGALDRFSAWVPADAKPDPELGKVFIETTCPRLSLEGLQCVIKAESLDVFKACDESDAMVGVLGSKAIGWTPPPKPGVDSWYINSTTSRMDGITTTFALRMSSDEIPVGYKSVFPILNLRCKGKRFEVYVNVDTQIHNESHGYDFDRRTTRVKLDAGEPKKWWATESTSGDALFLSKPVSFAKLLRGKKRLLFEFTPFQRGPVTAEFRLDGVDDVLGKMVGCKL
jgi:hypothetical protein